MDESGATTPTHTIKLVLSPYGVIDRFFRMILAMEGPLPNDVQLEKDLYTTRITVLIQLVEEHTPINYDVAAGAEAEERLRDCIQGDADLVIPFVEYDYWYRQAAEAARRAMVVAAMQGHTMAKPFPRNDDLEATFLAANDTDVMGAAFFSDMIEARQKEWPRMCDEMARIGEKVRAAVMWVMRIPPGRGKN